MPQKTQEMLVPRPTFFDGSAQKAEDWLQMTKEFANFNQIELSFAFDMLLRGDSKDLWQEFSNKKEAITNDAVEVWFTETFSNVKSIYDKIKELSAVRQRVDEKFRSYELRVRKLVIEVFEKKM